MKGDHPDYAVRSETVEFVTSGNLTYFRSCGDRFIASFIRHVDPSIKLSVYGEASKEGVDPAHYFNRHGGRISYTDLFKETMLGRFLKEARPIVEKKIGAVPENPKARLASKTYDYRFDALTFGRKTLAICHAVLCRPPRTMIWVDLDVTFHCRTSADFVNSLFQGKEIFYFGRASQHSETGVMGLRTGAPGVRELASRSEELLLSLSFKELPGWTDCHVFDHVRSTLEREGRLSTADLSPGQDGHVIAKSILAPYLDHMKGPRKFAGYSPERKRYLERPVP